MRFDVLGPLQVTGQDGRVVELVGAKPRALLTLLLSQPGRVVGIDRIVDTLWGDDPPPTVTGTLQSYVSQLRRALEPGRGPRQAPAVLLTRPPGYAVQVAEEDLDLLVFTRLVEDGDRAVTAGDPDRGVALLDRAMDLWRGEPLAELSDAPGASTERLRIVELHVRAQERRCDALLALGRPEAAISDLQRLVAENPLRERLWARLVTALYQADRQAEALDACRRCAALLREELGIDPGPELRDLERAVLTQDPRLVQRLPRPELPPSVTGGPAPPASTLVGRLPELARLTSVVDEVGAGHARLVVLEGEAGIGKTRLAEAAADLARDRGWPVAWSRCADEAGAPALWPWTQVLEQLGRPPLEPAGTGDEDDADAARFQLFQDLCGRLTEAAGPRPVLVVLDDLQGADTTSVQLLGLLARHLRAPVLLVVTVRTVGEDLPGAVALCLTRISREASTTRLVLAGLDAADVSALLAAQLGTAGDRGLAEAVHDRTGGNPFFVVELSRWMVGAHDLHLDRAPVPPSVRDVLRTRLARLPAETLDVLQVAAVLGREAGLDLLEAAGTPPEQAVVAMDTALAVGLVVDGQAAWTWRFTHALVREVLLGDMPRLRLARLHGRVAEALERQGPDALGAPGDALDERLAHHFVEATPVLGPARALHWSVRAAEAARRRLAHDEAAAHTRRALGLLARSTPVDVTRRLDLLTALGNDLLRSGHLLEAQQVVAEAITAAQASGDRCRLADAAAVWGGVTLWNWRPHGVVDRAMVGVLEGLVADDPGGGPPTVEEQRRTARLLGTLGVELAFSQDLVRGVRHAERAIALARELGDPELLGRTLNNYGLAVWGRPGAAELRLSATDEALALAGHGLPRRTEFFARLHRAAIRLHLTDVAGFDEDLSAARRLALSLSGPEVRPHVLWQAAGAAWLRGDAAAAEQLTTEAYDLYRVVTPHARHAWAAHLFALRRAERRLDTVLDLLVETGDEGSPLLREMAVLAAAEGGDPGEAWRLRRRWGRTEVRDWASDVAVLLQAESALLLDDEPEWDAAVASLLPFSGRQAVLGTPAFSLGSYDELLGRFAEHRGDPAGAARWWRAAQAQAHRVGSPHQLRRASVGLSRLAG
ncbi:Transcriptional regulator, putative ATPase, winged helix family [Modestobacter italicus]|uniref:Transcriptional regulator, putative ATPase, winged helix family n=1 Tax=Modestobacter italicus (strain DSM 44449 / CECT 9708 / BC 501) TaxID=2732864 RepID=I4EQR0_MODI5|nr:AfsR/SARP family transcriptional regulator [Modestobacter marinus]CCH85723.1 Transcriptional regulator, putative ATPase, winged helix family [Modestobacter marinus]